MFNNLFFNYLEVKQLYFIFFAKVVNDQAQIPKPKT